MIPVKIVKEDKAEYIQALVDSRNQDSFEPFREFMMEEHTRNISKEIEEFKNSQADDPIKDASIKFATDDKSVKTDDKPTIILAHLKEKGSCRTAELSALLGLKPTQTKAYLYKLLQEGKIVAHGANKNRTYSIA